MKIRAHNTAAATAVAVFGVHSKVSELQVVSQIRSNSSIERTCKSRAPVSAKEIRHATMEGAEHVFIRTLIKQRCVQLKHAFFR